MPSFDVAAADEFPPGSSKIVVAGPGEYVLLLAGFGKGEPSIRVLPV